MNDRKALKRVLKPLIEKKRRDRINQRLDELRTILLRNTSDMRLKNPKLEKAEILDLTVDYIRRRSNGNDSKVTLTENTMKESSAPVTSAEKSQKTGDVHEHIQPAPNTIYSAGFRECLSRLDNYIDCVDPSQRERFVQELRGHLDAHSAFRQGTVQTKTFPLDLQTWGPAVEGPCFQSRVPNRKDSTLMGHQPASREATFPYINPSLPIYPNTFVLHHHHSGQHLSPPYPSPPYSISPPPSPCYSSSSSPFSTTPPFVSIPCHFPFPSPTFQTSSETQLSFSHAAPLPAVPLLPSCPTLVSSPPTPLRPVGPSLEGPARTLRRSLFQIQSQAVWRPWP